MPLLIVATAVCGTAVALDYRSSLQVVNDIAPEGQRAHVASAYFVCGFAGNALPVIGVGVIATMANPIIASIGFAALISVFAAVALALGVTSGRLKEP
jgi:MFS family permease